MKRLVLMAMLSVVFSANAFGQCRAFTPECLGMTQEEFEASQAAALAEARGEELNEGLTPQDFLALKRSGLSDVVRLANQEHLITFNDGEEEVYGPPFGFAPIEGEENCYKWAYMRQGESQTRKICLGGAQNRNIFFYGANGTTYTIDAVNQVPSSCTLDSAGYQLVDTKNTPASCGEKICVGALSSNCGSYLSGSVVSCAAVGGNTCPNLRDCAADMSISNELPSGVMSDEEISPTRRSSGAQALDEPGAPSQTPGQLPTPPRRTGTVR